MPATALLPSMDVPRAKAPGRRRWALLVLAGLALAAAVTVALSRLSAAAPSVDRSALWIDTVRRGPLLREVRGPGLLVPEQIRYVSAAWPARVEAIHVKPGAVVDADTVLLSLANPELELQALEAERQLTSARAALVELETQGKSQLLAQEGALETLRFEAEDARQKATADQELSGSGAVSFDEVRRGRAKADELSRRLALDERRREILGRGLESQLSAQREQLARLEAVAGFRRRQVFSLEVRAGSRGVLQELPLQPGQWVSAGTLLAKVAQPEKLKAEVRIAEAQARDVQAGQTARIDTRHGVVDGVVSRVDPAVQAGTVRVEVRLEGPLPKGARPDLSVEGTVELERLADVLQVGRPAFASAEGPSRLFRLDGRGGAAQVNVSLGNGSVGAVAVKEGLAEGDQIILSDMSQYESNERVVLR